MSCGQCELKEAELKAAAEVIEVMSTGLLMMTNTCLEYFEYLRADVLRYKPAEIDKLNKAVNDLNAFRADVEKEKLKRNETRA